MSKISVSIGGKDYDINLEGDFALRFESDFKKLFDSRSSLEIKELLWAFVQKSYDNFILENQIEEQIKKIDEVW